MIPEALQIVVVETFGDRGKQWLIDFPDILSACENRWLFKVEKPFVHLSFNFVAPVVLQYGFEAVLKMGVPGDALNNEIAALEYFKGHGMARLMDSDKEHGAFLIERMMPGEMLTSVENDEQATAIACDVMQKLWRPLDEGAQHPFPRIDDWLDEFIKFIDQHPKGIEPFTKKQLDRFKGLSKELLDSMGERVLLHGDLHHENILSASREPWLAIDPKGVIGEREFEVGALLRNPVPELMTKMNAKQLIPRRLDQMSEYLGLDRERLQAWGYVITLMACFWTYQGAGSFLHEWLACAEIFC